MTGKTVLHYNIIEKLGEGGMGVVYKAEDTKLNRTVALKFLPEKAISSDQDRARFSQEAKAAANLNHPNICTIHAIEQDEGKTFIVMEYVDGVTLNEKIPFRIPSAAFDAAIQIGDALAEAHAKGIVHRDIKSENIMITPKGQIKVMDFGLAKLKGTLKLTRTSSTVGTLGYMSPEQIQGGEVDHRSDIFSLGVVLFEMLTGQLPFRGEHEAAIVYSIVNEEPKRASDLVPALPPGLDTILAKAFEKDPNERYQSAADFAVDLKRLKKQSSTSMKSSASVPRVPASTPQVSPAAIPAERRGNTPLYFVLALLVIALGYIGYLSITGSDYETAHPVSYARLTEQAGDESLPDISPDGNYITYEKGDGESSDIFVQRAGGGNPLNLTEKSGTDNSQPSYSPKGDLIAFRSERDGGGIFLMGSTGESVRRLTDFGYNPSWAPDGQSIVIAMEAVYHPFSRNGQSEIWKIDVTTGEKTLIFNGDGVQPRWSPDGEWIVFWGLPRGTGKRELWAIRATGGETTRLTEDDAIDWNPVWSSDGRMIYFLSDRGGTMNIWRIGFDPGSGSRLSDPVPVTVPSQNCTGMAISRDGDKLLYVVSEIRGNIYRIAFDTERLTTSGSPVPVTEGSRRFDYLSASPDGRFLAFTLQGVQEDIGLMQTDGSGFRKLTNDRSKDRGPVWSSDGRRIAFYSERGGDYQIWTINTDGSGITEVTNEKDAGLLAWPIWITHRNSIYYTTDKGGEIVELSGGTPVTGIVLPPFKTGFNFEGSSLSPDGNILAGSVIHTSGISSGIVLFSFADSSYRQISETGDRPKWLNDGRTLLIIEKGRLSIMDTVTGQTSLLTGIPFISSVSQFTISPDNRSIYFIRTESESDIWMANLR